MKVEMERYLAIVLVTCEIWVVEKYCRFGDW